MRSMRRFVPLLLVGALFPAGSLPAAISYVMAQGHSPYSGMGGLATDIFGSAALPTITMALSYPSPFNPTSTITWTQPDWMSADLSIVSLTGQVVQVIPFGYRGPGVYSYTWTQLWDGVYSYTLTTDGHALNENTGC